MNNTVISKNEGAVAWVRLNRPERLNAMNRQLVDGLSRALADAEADEGIRAVILHGEGRAFCSGDDLKDLDAQTACEADTQAWVEAIQNITLQIMQSRKIVIAAVHGWCVGGALEWAINCDFRLFSESARWFFPEVTYGLFVTGGVTALLTKQVGPQVTKELLMLGERHDARKALDVGIAWKVVPDDRLLEEARGLALRIAERPADAVADAKRAINAGLHSTLQDAMARETAATVRGFLSPQAQARAKEF
ncbi:MULTISPECIES: enoyl-CoA hydratase/isomerase family protein [Sinorhizobium]|jgi:enoyl-CoA hydratase/carnithine racemase|uniref:enoyl-CoA hydratase/isomerase family protein n=1 Tax=Sinorhizobium TaxID=28105 RepID=UPI00036029FE|nr:MULTISPECIES: enoyl-CoA hydratase/isomerase family protein [Sinorhizobium]RVP96827.1 enoyl-CoA hydratase/isomerase family protein [Sinorhizobium meliloti]WEJ12047.1 enoyl-CoA hydratase/isomerase family protein [Sinorhizobium sp. M103]WEJ17303.1 enoyl-CoA hydratase/isomerase family protein [Sinorhizobium sp. K101]WEJ40132.1 enoyl-CoA hydratase/isomerase family protein [Sinorhizobium sp. C101]